MATQVDEADLGPDLFKYNPNYKMPGTIRERPRFAEDSLNVVAIDRGTQATPERGFVDHFRGGKLYSRAVPQPGHRKFEHEYQFRRI